MQIAIDIPKNIYDKIKDSKLINEADNKIVARAIIKGMVLNGYTVPVGELKGYCAPSSYSNVKIWASGIVDNALSIIKADRSEKE